LTEIWTVKICMETMIYVKISNLHVCLYGFVWEIRLGDVSISSYHTAVVVLIHAIENQKSDFVMQ
jgi:hypothetical protein